MIKYLIAALIAVALLGGGVALVQHSQISSLKSKLEQSQKDLGEAVRTNKQNQAKFDSALATQKKLSEIAQAEAKASKVRADKYRRIADAINNTPDTGEGVPAVVRDTVDRLWDN